jgi:predicted AAA+ superfamily ATPase
MVFDTSLMVYADGTARRRLLDNRDDRGRLVEPAVGASLLARSMEEDFRVFWWREREAEVDFVIQKGSAVTAIEVKSGRLKNVNGSLEFLKKNPGALLLVAGGPNISVEDFLLGKQTLFR